MFSLLGMIADLGPGNILSQIGIYYNETHYFGIIAFQVVAGHFPNFRWKIISGKVLHFACQCFPYTFFVTL